MYQPMFPSLTGNTGQKGALTLGASKRPNVRKANSIIRKRTKDVPYDHAGKFPKENVENVSKQIACGPFWLFIYPFW